MSMKILNDVVGILKVKVKSLSRVQLFVTPWTIHFMELSRPEYWNEQPFPSPGDLHNPRIKPGFLALQSQDFKILIFKEYSSVHNNLTASMIIQNKIRFCFVLLNQEMFPFLKLLLLVGGKLYKGSVHFAQNFFTCQAQCFLDPTSVNPRHLHDNYSCLY